MPNWIKIAVGAGKVVYGGVRVVLGAEAAHEVIKSGIEDIKDGATEDQ